MQRTLAGTVNGYSRHFIVKTPKVANWPSKIAFANPFVNTLLQQVTRLKQKQLGPAKVTCSDFSTAETSPVTTDGITDQNQADLLLFPESLTIKNVKAAEISMLIDWINECYSLSIPLRNFTNRDQQNLAPIPITKWGKSTILVCTHNEMDCRCGDVGTKVYNHLTSLNLVDTVLRSSHIGGHEFAANLIVYPSNPNGNSSFGDWYGGVNIDNVDRWLEIIKAKRIPKEFWRGRQDLTKQQQLSIFEKL
jgi:hypothetical protein